MHRNDRLSAENVTFGSTGERTDRWIAAALVADCFPSIHAGARLDECATRRVPWRPFTAFRSPAVLRGQYLNGRGTLLGACVSRWAYPTN